MSAKRALIVDDSKSARAFLSRILSRYEIDVDTSESAEQAIEYLATHRPDVIFMDHLMPGMDGFQALQLIKNNPRTATIPIMMYTSQEGELYVGQARALGAIGVLPKQIQPADVSKVLYQLRLIPDRRTDEQRSFTPANVPAESVVAASAPVAIAESTGTAPSLTEMRPMVDAVVGAHISDLRRHFEASFDDQAARLAGELRNVLREQSAPPSAPPALAPWGWLTAAVASALAIGAGFFTWQAMQETRRLAGELAAVRASLAESRADVERLSARAAAAAAAGDAVDPRDGTRLLGVAQFGYGDPPLSDEALASVRETLSRLAAESFEGTVDVRTFAGRFCLVGNASDGWSLAPEETPYSRCDTVGNPALDGLPLAQRESLGFANLAAETRRESGGRMEVSVSSGRDDAVAAPYPEITDALTAGDWNRVALANNRLEIRAAPRRP
jgi:CheY-like chemotaxis protein